MKTTGILSIIFGGLITLQSFFSVIALAIEDFVFSNLATDIFNDPTMPFNVAEFIHEIAIKSYIFMPFEILIGIFFILIGIKVSKSDDKAINNIKFVSKLQIAWYLIYSIIYYPVIENIFSTITPNSLAFNVIYFVSMFIGAIFTIGLPIFILIYFRNHKLKTDSEN